MNMDAQVTLSRAGATFSSAGLSDVRTMMVDSLRSTSLSPVVDEIYDAIIGGKMLRARLVLEIGEANAAPRDNLLHAASAVEMVHAASLLHDDVIDGGLLRRGAPSFWKKKSVSGAILLGDLMVCKAVQMLVGVDDGRLGNLLVRLAGEMCDAEVEQELISRGEAQNWDKSVVIARKKTGSLFAFAAAAADGSDEILGEALLEAGYRIGTAYQLADDIMDACGEQVRDGKDLGKDAPRGKLTSVSAVGGSDMPARRCIRDLCNSSMTLLTPWPCVRDAWNEYLQNDFSPVVKMFSGER